MLAIETDGISDRLARFIKMTLGLLDELLNFKDIKLKVAPLDDVDVDGEGLAGGAVFVDTNDAYSTKDPSTVFTIGVHPTLTYSELAVMLAHEAVHLQQYSSGRLITEQDAEGDVFTTWEGIPFLIDEDDDIPYEDLPWEVEAYDRQDDIVAWLLEQDRFIRLIEEITITRPQLMTPNMCSD